MRLILRFSFNMWLLIISLTATASNRPGTAWEVFNGCRLIEAGSNDGDSFKVKHQDKEFIIRLYYIDCPETYDTYVDRLKDQARYFSIPESEVIEFGKIARKHTLKFLKDEFTVITRWEDARGGKEARYFGIVRKNDRLLSAELVRNGLARIYGMPTKDKWPGGFKPTAYLKQLKQQERSAQQAGKGIWGSTQNSLQPADLSKIGNQSGTYQTDSTRLQSVSNNRGSKLILNTASAHELDTLPGIGPSLAKSIIAERPFESIDDLAKISGISLKKIDAFRDLVLLNAPPPPPMTAAFYLADSDTYLNKEITVRVSMITHAELAAPNGFQSVYLETANQGESGGSILAFVPAEYQGPLIDYYQTPGRKFTGLLFRHNKTIVLVYRRK